MDLYAGNLLLETMPRDAYAVLRPFLEPKLLPAGKVLVEPDVALSTVHFLTDGVASQATARSGTVELGIIGREGLSDTTAVLGEGRSPYRTVVQIAGSCMQISTFALTYALDRSEVLRTFLTRYVQVQKVQLAQTQLQANRLTLEDRTARLLLMCHDRVDGDLMPVSQSFLGAALDLNSSEVCAALRELAFAGLIRASRGWVEICDRRGLEKKVGDGYGTPESEYTRLLGPWSKMGE